MSHARMARAADTPIAALVPLLLPFSCAVSEEKKIIDNHTRK